MIPAVVAVRSLDVVIDVAIARKNGRELAGFKKVEPGGLLFAELASELENCSFFIACLFV